LTSSATRAGNLPLVAIVGRPNVGKSTLFNRLMRRRIAITDSRPGVTRDPLSGVLQLDGGSVRLVDTGGIRPGAEGMDAEVSGRSLAYLEKADLIVFMLEIGELTGEDQEVLAVVRRFADKVVLVVNKVDTEAREGAAGEYLALGFPDTVFLSSAHGRNCGELEDMLSRRIDFSRFPESGAEPSPGQDATIAVLGKPNTGKSTLFNRLLGSEESIVSPIPGTTRDVLEGRFEYRGKVIRILDTAGIRRKAKVTEDVEYYSVNRAIAGIRDADVVFLLIDAVEGLAEQDKKIADQIVRKGRGIVLALNKWDLMEGGKGAFKTVESRLRFQFPVLDFAPVIPISARTGWNLDRLPAAALEIKAQLERRVETGVLNRALASWTGENPPPRDGRRRFKIRYMTQVRTRPLRFVLFVNHGEGFPASYIGYIKNRLRSDFGFRDVPLDIEVRSRDRD